MATLICSCCPSAARWKIKYRSSDVLLIAVQKINLTPKLSPINAIIRDDAVDRRKLEWQFIFQTAVNKALLDGYS